MDNNIQFIDKRLAHLRTLIPQCKAQSAAAEKRLADSIINLEIKRIEAIHALENRLGELRAIIPVYKTRCPTYEHVLAKQIINLDLQLIAAKKTIPKTFNCTTYICTSSTCTSFTCTKFIWTTSTRTIKRFVWNYHWTPSSSSKSLLATRPAYRGSDQLLLTNKVPTSSQCCARPW